MARRIESLECRLFLFGDAVDVDVQVSGPSYLRPGAAVEYRIDISNNGTDGMFDSIVYNGVGELLEDVRVVQENVFGTPVPLQPSVFLESVSSASSLVASDASSSSSGNITGIGDFNGDGFDDVVVGDSHRQGAGLFRIENDPGRVLVAFGNVDGSFDLANLDGQSGFEILSRTEGAHIGNPVGSADINGDGLMDILLGAPELDIADGDDLGGVFVIYGTINPKSQVYVEDLNGNDGFAIAGTASGANLGYAISGAGDVNGDGYDDMVVGMPEVRNSVSFYAGEAWIVYGRAAFPAMFEIGDNLNSTLIQGIHPNGGVGVNVSGIGDINDDGFADVAVGTTGLNDLLRTYVVFGGSTLAGKTILGDSLNGADGFVFNAVELDDDGPKVNAAGDFDGDGIDDLVISVTGIAGESIGSESYIIYGKSSFPDVVLPSDSGVTTIRGKISFGISSAGGGDFDGDGFDDILLGNGQLGFGPVVVYGRADRPEIIDLRGAFDDDTAILLNTTFVTVDGGVHTANFAGDYDGDGRDDLLTNVFAYDATFRNPYMQLQQAFLVFGAPRYPNSGDFRASPGPGRSTTFTVTGRVPDVVICEQEVHVFVDTLDLNNELNPEDNAMTISVAVIDSSADVNEDELIDDQDIDAMSEAVRNESTDAVFDVDGDGIVSSSDRDFLIDQLLSVPAADADLDGQVSFSDFLNLSAGFGQEAGWQSGDFSGDGKTDFEDFLLLSQSYGKRRTC